MLRLSIRGILAHKLRFALTTFAVVMGVGFVVGAFVVTDSLRRMRERGEVLSSLFPTTASLYRSLGYEIAGTHRRHRIPIEELPDPDGSVVWEPSTWDATDVRSVANRAGIDHDGWLVLPELEWQWHEYQRQKESVTADVYVGRRDGRPVRTVQHRAGRQQRPDRGPDRRRCGGLGSQAMQPDVIEHPLAADRLAAMRRMKRRRDQRQTSGNHQRRTKPLQCPSEDQRLRARR